jgi:hypothetical protein
MHDERLAGQRRQRLRVCRPLGHETCREQAMLCGKRPEVSGGVRAENCITVTPVFGSAWAGEACGKAAALEK